MNTQSIINMSYRTRSIIQLDNLQDILSFRTNQVNNDSQLNNLRNKKQQADRVIELLKHRINYLKNKEQKEQKRDQNKKRRSEELQKIKKRSLETKKRKQQKKMFEEQELKKKIESNHELRYNIEFNKAVGMTLLAHQIRKKAQSVKSFKKRNSAERYLNSQRSHYEAVQKVKHIKQEKISPNQKKQMIQSHRVLEINKFKQRKLNWEIKIKNKNIQKLQDLISIQNKLKKQVVIFEKQRYQCQQNYNIIKRRHSQFNRLRAKHSRSSMSQNEDIPNNQVQNIFIS